MSALLKLLLTKSGMWPKSSRTMVIAGAVIVAIVLSLDAYAHIVGLNPFTTSHQVLSPPSFAHVMGTDQIGRELFSRVSFGTTFSLLVAFVSVAISVSTGSAIGALSGFFGGKTDRVTSLAFDALYALPPLIIAILIAAMIGPGIINTGLAIAIGYMPQYFRVVRGIILSIKERPFIESTRSIGAGYGRLIFHHMIPYAIPSIIALITLNMGSGIVDVAGLGFLGLGLPPPTPEWGTDLGRGRDFITSGAWWPSTFPGLMIVISVLGFTLLGQGLDEIFRSTSTKQKEKF
jgi:peptide/nickel transport system permease protein